MAVSDRIRAVIEERGLRQAAIASRLGEPEYWLSNRLTGRTAIKADELPRLAEALDVHPCDLLDVRAAHEAVSGADRMATDTLRGLSSPEPTAREMRQLLALMRFMNSWRDEED